MNQLCLWQSLCDDLTSILGLVVEVSTLLDDLNRVTLAILRLQIVRRAKDHESTVDHDSDAIAKLLSFVHTMRCQQDRSHVHLLDHAVE